MTDQNMTFVEHDSEVKEEPTLRNTVVPQSENI